MAYGEINQSPAIEAIQSPGLELDAHPITPRTLISEGLLETRGWIGLGATWLPPYYGESGPASPGLPWLPSVTWRQAYRKRWTNMALTWNNSGHSYSADYYMYANDGCVPMVNGMPVLINPDFSYPFGVISSDPGHTDIWNTQMAILNGFMGGGTPFVSFPLMAAYSLGTVTASTMSYSEPAAGGNPGPDDVTATLTGDVPFTDRLGPLATRIAARSFGAYPDGTLYWERMLDGRSTPGLFELDPSVFNGSADTGGISPMGSFIFNLQNSYPYFGGNDNYTAWEPWAYTLCSGWYLLSGEEIDSNAATGAGISDDLLWGRRTRFVAQAGASYFIAQAILLSSHFWDGNGYATMLDPWQTLTDVTIVSTGTSDGSTPIEIGWPDATTDGYNDFVTKEIPPGGSASIPSGTNTLSYGCIRFAIVNETAAAWSARTGIAYT